MSERIVRPSTRRSGVGSRGEVSVDRVLEAVNSLDATAREAARRALREAVPDVLWATDARGRVTADW